MCHAIKSNQPPRSCFICYYFLLLDLINETLCYQYPRVAQQSRKFILTQIKTLFFPHNYYSDYSKCLPKLLRRSPQPPARHQLAKLQPKRRLRPARRQLLRLVTRRSAQRPERRLTRHTSTKVRGLEYFLIGRVSLICNFASLLCAWYL